MIRFFITTTLFIVCFGRNYGQSTAYVFSAGPTAGLQKWDNSYNREPLFQYHASFGMESINNDDDRYSFLMQIGYHVKGSALRFRYYNINSGFPGGLYTERFKFNNLSLVLGAKQRFDFGVSGNTKYFYYGGIRVDYTLNTNIDELNNETSCNRAQYPFMSGVQRWMGGFSVGGGLEFKLSELVGGQIQLSIHPDVTTQYRQSPILNVIDLCNPGYVYNIEEQRIRNTAVEISIGLRLLKKVIIVD
ncbi:MAG: hypothetical protein JNJ57_10670 [Saprospiraceae bacterium]|nr:hypothetical protein [Saprospiraceae bacterium]